MGWFTRFTRASSAPKVAHGACLYAVGDIHGRLDLLGQLIQQIYQHAARHDTIENTLVFLGDYIDRGSDSKGVVECLLSLAQSEWKTIFLRGNHEQALLDFLADPNFYRSWRSFGAAETLLSYGVQPPQSAKEEEYIRAQQELSIAMPAAHLKFFENLKLFYAKDDYFFCHAGVRPGISLEEQSAEDLLWIRNDFLDHRRMFQKVIVHGHTPTPFPTKFENRIGIDTGAHATGCLTAVALEGMTYTFLQTTNSPLPLTADALS